MGQHLSQSEFNKRSRKTLDCLFLILFQYLSLKGSKALHRSIEGHGNACKVCKACVDDKWLLFSIWQEVLVYVPQ